MTFIVDGSLGGTFPTWTTATRPASPAVGQMGYNTTTGLFDQYIAAGWTPLGAAAGSVLQVVTTNYGNQEITTSTSYVDTSLTTTITPKFSSSKILILVNANGCYASSTANSIGKLRLLRGATALNQFGAFGFETTVGTVITSASASLLDSPATTSSTTYKMQILVTSGTGGFNTYGGSSTLTLMEIAA